MREFFAVFLGLLAVTAHAEVTENTSDAEAEAEARAGERLIWSDEFDTLNETKWQHLVTCWDGGNREFQYYRNNRKNSFVRDSKLFIRPTLTQEEVPDLERGRHEEPGCNLWPCLAVGGPEDIVNPVFSARLLTRYRFSFLYGRVKIRAKMPAGDWIWPAIWMMPEQEIFGQWPRSGEIDIVESRGNADLKDPTGRNHGNVEMGSALHFGPAWNDKAMINGLKLAKAGQNWANSFHDYELEWTKDKIKFTVDGEVISDTNIPAGGFTQLGNLTNGIYKGKNKNTPFDQKFYLIVNVAVGGEFFPQSWTSNGLPRPWPTWGDSKRQFWNQRARWLPTWGSPDQHAMQIDYIRVYQ